VTENLRRRGIVGYADRLSVQPGETIRFMVSSERPRYRAQVVRLIHGDANPAGPGLKELLVDTPLNGEYAGARQDLPLGSYVRVPDHPSLRLDGSFTVTAWIAPTSQRDQTGAPGSFFVGAEGMFTKWSDADDGGYGVFIDEDGRLALRLTGTTGASETVHADRGLHPWVPAIFGMNNRPQGVSTAWYFIAVSFDAATGQVVLYQDPINDFPFDPTRGVTERQTEIRALATSDVPVLIGAAWESPWDVRCHYNGKIDNPRVYGRRLRLEEIAAIRNGGGPDDGTYRDTRRPRHFRHVPLWGIPVRLVYAPRRVWCVPCAGVHVEALHWAVGTQRCTRALLVTIATWTRVLPWQQVATLFGCAWGTVERAVEAAVEAAVVYGLAHRDVTGVTHIGIDEISRRKGHVYVTNVYDLTRKRLLWSGEGRTRATLEAFVDFLGVRTGSRRWKGSAAICGSPTSTS